jgi:hypothetical protein
MNNNDKTKANCAIYKSRLPAYLDYVLYGRKFEESEITEEHLVSCAQCAQDYSELLGLIISFELEKLSEWSLQGLELQAYKEAPVEIDFLIEATEHWLFTCQMIENQSATNFAQSYLGLLYEIKKETALAKEHHKNALNNAIDKADCYTSINSNTSLSRIYQIEEKWAEAYAHLCKAEKNARELQDAYSILYCLISFGDYYWRRSEDHINLGAAVSSYEEALAKAKEIGSEKLYEIAEARINAIRKSLIEKLKQATVQFFHDSSIEIDQIPQNFYDNITEHLFIAWGKYTQTIPIVSINLDLDPVELQRLINSSTTGISSSALTEEAVFHYIAGSGELKLNDTKAKQLALHLYRALHEKKKIQGKLHYS